MLRNGNAAPSLRPAESDAINPAARRGHGWSDDAGHAFADLVPRRVGRHRQLATAITAGAAAGRRGDGRASREKRWVIYDGEPEASKGAA